MLAQAARAASRKITRYRPRAQRLATAATTSNAGPCPVENELVELFDHPQQHSSSPLSPTGLFAQRVLTQPSGFHSLTHATLLRAHLLTERIVRAKGNREELLKVVKNLDRLSDILCSVIDLCELVRNSHPDGEWVESANDAYEHLCEYMNVLNTSTGLYEVLKEVLHDPSITSALSREAYYTALIFWRDFEKSGISLPPDQRARFVQLSSSILTLGRTFLSDAQSARPPAHIAPAELEGLRDDGMGARLRWQSKITGRELLVYPGSVQAQMIMRSAPKEEPRRKVYMASNASSEDQVRTLEELLRARGELARLVGTESFGHMTLGDKMAKSPEHVGQFLETLMEHTRPHARKALRALSDRKAAHLGLPAGSRPTIHGWDRDYYCPPEPPAPPLPLPPLTIGTVMRALSRLFSHLYGIRLRPAPLAPGEAWHPDVRKLVVEDSTGTLGYIFADLFARRGKAGGAAHYAVRCSRRVDDDDVAGDLPPPAEYADLAEVSREFEVGGHQGGVQLPVVALLTEFARPVAGRGATVLEWHEVLTLYHEMGHAMHSMIGRTDYQNVSGTRCATDFVELPSILMEHFLTSPSALALFLPNPPRTLHPSDGAANHHEDPCRNIDTYGQILLAALDQQYHSPAALEPGFNSTAVLADLVGKKGLIPYEPGTSWQTQFGHLFGYGATYYSYLFDRAIASRVWRQLFVRDPLSREMGERYKNEVLRYGGGEDPWKMLGGLLGEEVLLKGDTEAMREVGRWRVGEELAVPGRH
ncbi:unnamed protein product [Peniophora sp. CBMAI 1063]|nr:unnamed protein product [Peniophora sp. CBMAI 1063]